MGAGSDMTDNGIPYRDALSAIARGQDMSPERLDQLIHDPAYGQGRTVRMVRNQERTEES